MLKNLSMRLTTLSILCIMLLAGCQEGDDEENEQTLETKACFEHKQNGGATKFINCSENAESFDWEFGDGGTSIAESPSHEYLKAGKFKVTLRVTGSGGSNTITQNVTIEEKCMSCKLVNLSDGETTSSWHCGSLAFLNQFSETWSEDCSGSYQCWCTKPE